ncbi:matrix protein [Salmon aquaparamyxovirus]|uniref:Matrix protein n=1 Tax=Salmon aquaparamyxovirus TaxID=381543 RepID=B2BX75_9MONO|nr:matrix protein [Salmon aquaparamyxovirus]ABX57740.1 matrix protein [Salmon aquaparamyxovirus]
MEGTSEFSRKTWEENGTVEPVEFATDKDGVAVPTIRMTSAGDFSHKGEPYIYLMLLGFVEKVIEEGGSQRKGKMYCYGAMPLGMARTHYNEQALLEASGNLRITVRRTAGGGEKAVFGVSGVTSPLMPWKNALSGGMIYPALKTLSAPYKIPLGVKVRMRVIFVSGTILGDITIYKIPKALLDVRVPQSISFNLNVIIATGAKLSARGIDPVMTPEGQQTVSFLVHIGHFVRDRKKVYSADYCRHKVDMMGLKFSLGNVGGVSFHVAITGKMSKTLMTSIGFKKNICYPLMDTNPTLNSIMWASSAEICSVSAVFQPSVPREFKYHDDIVVEGSGRVTMQKHWYFPLLSKTGVV